MSFRRRAPARDRIWPLSRGGRSGRTWPSSRARWASSRWKPCRRRRASPDLQRGPVPPAAGPPQPGRRTPAPT